MKVVAGTWDTVGPSALVFRWLQPLEKANLMRKLRRKVMMRLGARNVDPTVGSCHTHPVSVLW